MRTTTMSVLLAPLLATTAFSACIFDPSVPKNSLIACDGDDDCPPDELCQKSHVCRLASERDDTAPAVIDALLVGGDDATPGITVVLTFSTSEPLLSDPVATIGVDVDIIGTFAVDEDATDRGALAYTLDYVVGGGEPEGDADVAVALVDRAGNESSTVAGHVHFRHPRCGDLVVDASEECDDGNDDNTDACSNDCRFAFCGDAIVQAGELCDDGNDDDDDACTTICEIGVCGDGHVRADSDEECDDGNTESGDGCRSDCRKIERCGDGLLDDGEACDDANANENDGCDACRTSTFVASLLLGLGRDSGVGIAAALNYPVGVAIDNDGDVFFADSDNCFVRKVSAGAGASIVAGRGTFESSGDGGPASAAGVSGPFGVAVDGLGQIFIAETDGQRVRKIDVDGIITTIAGGGTVDDDDVPATSVLVEPMWIAVDGLGRVYFTETVNDRLRRIELDGTISSVGGVSISRLDHFTLDAQARPVFVDGGVRIVRLDDEQTGALTVLAGSVFGAGDPDTDGIAATAALLINPRDVAFDRQGRLYVTELSAGARIRRIDIDAGGAPGVITTVAGKNAESTENFTADGQPALGNALGNPESLAIGADGVMVYADASGNLVRRIDTSGILTTIAGSGTVGGAVGATPTGVFATSIRFGSPFLTFTPLLGGGSRGELAVADLDGHMFLVGADGLATTVEEPSIGELLAVSVDADGRAIVVDGGHRVIAAIARPTGVPPLSEVTPLAGIPFPGEPSRGDGGPALDAVVNPIASLALDNFAAAPGSTIGVACFIDADENAVRCLSALDDTAVIDAVASGVIPQPVDVAFDGASRLVVGDGALAQVWRVDAAGDAVVVAGDANIGGTSFGDEGPALAAGFRGIDRVAAGPDGTIWVAESFHETNFSIDASSSIRRVDPDGIVHSVVPQAPASLIAPTRNGDLAANAYMIVRGLAVDERGRLLIADDGVPIADLEGRTANIVWRLEDDGTLTVVAGDVDPHGVGRFDLAALSRPSALVTLDAGVAAPLSAGLVTLIAGGTSGRMFRAARDTALLDVIAGMAQGFDDGADPVGSGAGGGGGADDARARFARLFDDASGVAYDDATRTVFVSERARHDVRAIRFVDGDDTASFRITTLTGNAAVIGDGDGGFAFVPAFRDGAPDAALFASPAGLAFDDVARLLYVADSGNHVVRAVAVTVDSDGAAVAVDVSTVIGTPQRLGFFGDGGDAESAQLFAPQAVAVGLDGSIFVADTGNGRVRRRVLNAGGSTITTVIGDGTRSSAGEGAPASTFPVDEPRGLAVDGRGDLLVTSRTALRLLVADDDGVIDGSGPVRTIYGGGSAGAAFPASDTSCLTGVAVVGDGVVDVVDECVGYLVELTRTP